MTAGAMRERVKFEKLDESAVNLSGSVMNGWVNHYECAARIRFMAGNEAKIQTIIMGQQHCEIVVRGCAKIGEVTPRFRIINTRNLEEYNIRSIVNYDERGEYITFLCDKGVAI